MQTVSNHTAFISSKKSVATVNSRGVITARQKGAKDALEPMIITNRQSYFLMIS